MLLRTLVFDPDRASLQSVQRQSLLTSLTLDMDGGCHGGHMFPEDACQGVASLMQLQSLTLSSMHFMSMGAAAGLAPCASLTHLTLSFVSCCEAYDPYENLDSCGLAPRKRLREVCLQDMAHEAELNSLQLGRLPALERLVLLAPQPFQGYGPPPAMPMPVLEVRLDGLSWDLVSSLLGDLVAVQRAARQQAQACFSVLQLSGWPASPAPEHADARIQALLFRLVSWGVRVESDGVLHCPDLPAELPAELSSSGEADSD